MRRSWEETKRLNDNSTVEALRRYVAMLDPGCVVERNGAEIRVIPTNSRAEYVEIVLKGTHPWAKVIR